MSAESLNSRDNRFERLLEPVVANRRVQQMRHFMQHGDTSCYEHSYRVARYSFAVCEALGLDTKSAVRGAMLHDFFLYSWREQNMGGGEHLWFHPKVALEMAEQEFDLNDRERDIIENHMWPITPKMPGCGESFVVSMMDKLSAIVEAGSYIGRRVGGFPRKYAGFIAMSIQMHGLQPEPLY